jgi:hypothetical protein
MKTRSSLILPLLLGLAGSASAAITIAGGNGSFETNTLGTATFPNAWYLNPQAASGTHATQWSNISGWTLGGPNAGAATGANAWLMGGSTYGTASNGNFQVNVEGGPDWWLSAPITGLTVGNTYTVQFDARRRDAGGSGTFDVFVNSTISLVGATGGFNVTASSTTWEQKSFTFVAAAETSFLTISNTDNPGGNGFMVDNFSVVPEPSAALLGGLGMLALLGRRRSR